MTICVVNRHKDKSIDTDIISQTGSFTGGFDIYEVNGPDIKSVNDFNKTTVKTITKPAIKVRGQSFRYAFPPHSFTLLKGKISEE